MVTTQVEAWQPLWAFARLQALPQAPQLFGSFVTSTSHAFVWSPSQSRAPKHAGSAVGQQALSSHAPAVQIPAGPSFATQSVPQAPQFLPSLETLASQPSTASPLQSAQGDAQAPLVHLPSLEQEAVACGIAHGAHDVLALQPFSGVFALRQTSSPLASGQTLAPGKQVVP